MHTLRKWRSLLCLLASLLVALSASACVSRDRDGDDSDSSVGLADTEEINVWVGDLAKDVFREIADAFTAQTGIKVTLTEYTGLNATDKLELDGPSGNGGDVYMQGSGGGLGVAVEKGLFSDLDLTDEALSLYTDEGLANYRYQGKLYGLPLGLEVPALIYNKALISDIPDTWEELIQTALSMTDIKARKYGFLMDLTNPFFTNSLSAVYGGYVYKQTDDGYDFNDIGVANAGAVKALKTMTNYALVDGLFSKTMEFNAMTQQFIKGNAAIIFDGPWNVKTYTDAGIDIGVAPLPKVQEADAYPQVYSGAYGLAVSAFSKYQEAAVEFVKFAAGREENVKKYYDLTLRIPALKSMLDMDEIKNDPIQSGFAAQTENSIIQPNIPEMELTWDPLINAAKAILTGGETVEAALASAEANIRQQLELMGK